MFYFFEWIKDFWNIAFNFYIQKVHFTLHKFCENPDLAQGFHRY